MTRLHRWPVVTVAAIVLSALAAPLLPLPDPLRVDAAHQLLGPSWAHWLGQDEYGRDVLSRLWWSVRTSVSIAAVSAVLAGLFGIVLGLVAGFLCRPAGARAVTAMGVMHCVPTLVFALLLIALFGPGVSTVTTVLVLVNVPAFARMICLGVAPANTADALLSQFACAVASALVLESSLSFLGLGVVPPALSWGSMIGGASATMAQAPLQMLWPCGALGLTILAMNRWRDSLRNPVDRYTLPVRERHSPEPVTLRSDEQPAGTSVLDVRNLSVEIDSAFGMICPVRDVTFSVRAGEMLAIVGEAGAGKSLTGLAIFSLLPASARVSQGAVWLQGRNLLRLDGTAMRRLLGGPMAMIFQDASGGLNPVQRVGTQITETLRAHWDMSRDEAWEEAVALLARVGMPDPERQAQVFPNQLSEEMRQRTMIAMAIANDPRLLFADEPAAGLDATIQLQLLDLLTDLRRELGMALVLTSNSLPMIAQVADRVMVMYAGEVVEQGTLREVLAAPLHPYTVALFSGVPLDDARSPPGRSGSMRQPDVLPPGCAFAPRCSLRISVCDARRPPLAEVASGRATRCLRWSELV